VTETPLQSPITKEGSIKMEMFAMFNKVFFVMVEIFLIILCGFLFLKFKIIKKEAVSGLTSLTINLFSPCLIFSHLIKNFSFNALNNWWVYPILGVFVSIFGLIVAKMFLLVNKSIAQKNEFSALIGFQNCGYMPLVFVAGVFPEALAKDLFTVIFLFVQGFNVIFWSLGVHLLSAKSTQLNIKKILNPPFIALTISFILIALNLKNAVPLPLLDASHLIGECTLPIALFTLGAILSINFEHIFKLTSFSVKVIIAKLIVMPALCLLGLMVFKMPQIMALLLIIETAMPSAVNNSIVSYNNQANAPIISQGVFFTHILSVLTIPLFIVLFTSLGIGVR